MGKKRRKSGSGMRMGRRIYFFLSNALQQKMLNLSFSLSLSFSFFTFFSFNFNEEILKLRHEVIKNSLKCRTIFTAAIFKIGRNFHFPLFSSFPPSPPLFPPSSPSPDQKYLISYQE